MRAVWNLLRWVALWLTVVGAGATAAAAQSFFEQLLGLGSQQAPVQQLGSNGAVLYGPTAAKRSESDGLRSNRREETPDAAGNAQTMCVRTCDGYYWPLHYPVSKRDFASEANLCQATCGAQARLYVRPGPGTDAEEMKDLDGNSYGASPNAFAYRKGLVNGCACRPMPWSDGERARHEGYALAEAEKGIRSAQVETERVKAAAEGPAVATAPVAAPFEPGPTATEGPPIGPAEAAALAAAHTGPPFASEPAGAPPPSSKREFMMAGAGDKPAKLKRTAARAAPVRVAAAQLKSLASWFGPPKYRYPGD